ncbi:hypothetical protein ACFV7R_16145 [Streptomyces sp. NPDC059866]|uniref:hypothetical protein n=1 Tax=Streptomyces sp. NPDC059866 TaxID=3346978 RepID=UPI003651F237
MTRTAGAARGPLGRLLLLGLLLIGLGVVHTLAHADAHDGVTGPTTTHHLDRAAADQDSGSAFHGHKADTAGEDPHRTTALAATDSDSLPEADCWASVPTGPWPVPPAQSAAGTTTGSCAAPPTEGLLSYRAHSSPQALGVLRI